MTCTFWPDYQNPSDNLKIENRTLALDGVELETEASFLQTGAILSIRVSKTPDSWDEKEKKDLANSLLEEMNFDLYIDGEQQKMPDRISSVKQFEKRYEIPVFPGDYGNVKEMVLIPKLRAYESVKVYDGTVTDISEAEKNAPFQELQPDGAPVVVPNDFSASWQEGPDKYSTVLDGCEIRIPIPEK